MSEAKIVYFGCWSHAGHYLWSFDGHTIGVHEAEALSIPMAKELDSSPLFLPRPEKVGEGVITYLPAPNLTVLAWWGNNPWDSRPNVNSAIISSGELGESAMWQRFARYFTELEPQLKRPTMRNSP